MASLFARQLKFLGAYPGAIEWVGDREFDKAWTSCENICWMFWLAKKLRVDPKLLVQIACRCARLALPWFPEGEERFRKALEAAEGWLEGKVSVEEVQVVNDAAWAAEAVGAVGAAGATISRASRAIRAAAWATAWAVWDACVAYASKAAQVTNNSQILNIIREVMAEPVREKLAALEV